MRAADQFVLFRIEGNLAFRIAPDGDVGKLVHRDFLTGAGLARVSKAKDDLARHAVRLLMQAQTAAKVPHIILWAGSAEYYKYSSNSIKCVYNLIVGYTSMRTNIVIDD